ncbi:hypothetical protein [Ferruginibacter sp.]|nr:hypothetical protein [Ferruginibacter sp.]
MQQLLKLTALFILLSGCNTYKTKYPYSLDDFKPELRKHLEKIVSNPFPDNIDEAAANYLDNHTSEKELRKIIKSEHPLLRAVAFKYLSLRESVDFSKVLLENLDDTAFVSDYSGDVTTVADYYIAKSRGHSTILKSDLMDEVINKHPYLSYAANFVQYEAPSNEKYYVSLKKIIAAPYPLHSRSRNGLITKLSEYKKNEDTSSIAFEISRNWYGNEPEKFALIENNPIDNYFFVIEKFYTHILHFNQRGLLQEMFWRDQDLERTFKNFIAATAAYKSKRSAEILLDIVKKKLYNKSTASFIDKNRLELEFKYHLLEDIKRYNCKYYKNIFPLIEEGAKKFSDSYIANEPNSNFQPNQVEEKTTW